MITKLTKSNIDEVKNPLLKKDAKRYIDIYEDFLSDIQSGGIKLGDSNETYDRKKSLALLTASGAATENNSNSVYINSLSPACIDCRKGVYSETYILTLKCNRDCFFCTNKNQYNYAETKEQINDITAEFKEDIKRLKKLSSVAVTGGEPLLYPEQCCTFFETVKNSSKTINTRLYTNGDLITESILKQLASSGLDELRAGIKINDDNSVDETIYETLTLAKKYIKRVVVEMPFTHSQLELGKSILLRLDEIGIFGINILEFLYPFINQTDYDKNNYRIKSRPYEILYDYSYAGGVPVSESDAVCLELMRFALDKKLKLSVHYCNLENKLSSQIYQQNFRAKLSANEIFSEKDFFIKSVRGYSLTDMKLIREKLDQLGVNDYFYNESDKFIEFSPRHIGSLKELDIELGLSYMIVDRDEYDRTVIREIAVDLVNPKTFELSDI